MSRLAIFPLLVLLAGLLPLAAMLPATLLPLQQGDLASTWQQLLHWPALGGSLLLSLLSSLGASLGALTLGLALAGRTLQQRRRHR
ncbi:ABC transporter permease, partial [Edwardsiella tarda]